MKITFLFTLINFMFKRKEFTNKVTKMKKEEIEISIYASRNKLDYVPWGIINYGHSFLSFKNKSSMTLFIAGYSLLPNEEITIGTWPISSNFGIWFNVEASYIKFKNKYSERVSITNTLTSSHLNHINEIIFQYGQWTIFKNCTYFAVNVWNALFQDDKLLSRRINSPKRLYREISKNNRHLVGKEIKYNHNIGFFHHNDFIQYTYGKDYVEN